MMEWNYVSHTDAVLSFAIMTTCKNITVELTSHKYLVKIPQLEHRKALIYKYCHNSHLFNVIILLLLLRW